MMRFMIAATVALFGYGAMPLAAQAQSNPLIHTIQYGFEIFIDSRGQRFLVDPVTDEVVGRANRNARFTRRDQIQAQREYQRANRGSRLESELDQLLGLSRRDRRERRRLRELETGQDRRAVPDASIYSEPLPDAPPRPDAGELDQNNVAVLPQPSEPAEAKPSLMRKPKYSTKQMMALQVFLDRTGFSPGVIDGRWGSNIAKAAASWKEATRSGSDLGDWGTMQGLLASTGGEPMTSYTITQADVDGPFAKRIPSDYAEKAQLPAMSFTSVAEMLAERFHMSQSALQSLNSGKNFNRPGTVLEVAAVGNNVIRFVHYIVADKEREQVRAYDRNGGLVAAYPATIGSTATPSPEGTHTVERIATNPEYTYNPKINFKQGENEDILTIPPGPNGPVGSVWIALSKPTYGIHGTPNPDTIGKTNSHGCIRLTNWDALELVKLVKPGVTVEFAG